MSYKHSYKLVIQFHVCGLLRASPLDFWPRALVSCDNMASTKIVSIVSLVCVGAAESFCAVSLIQCPVSFICGIEWHDQVESLRNTQHQLNHRCCSCAFQFYSRKDSLPNFPTIRMTRARAYQHIPTPTMKFGMKTTAQRIHYETIKAGETIWSVTSWY